MNARLAAVLALVLACSWARPAFSGLVVLDFDHAPTGGYFTGPLLEDDFWLTVNSGHYDIFGGTDRYLVTDDDLGFMDFSELVFARSDGGLFNAESMIVGIPAQADNFSLIAVGNSGNVSAPTVSGLYTFGDDFRGISSLLIRQNATGVFSLDDLTFSLPVPSAATLPLCVVALLCLGPVRKRRFAIR